MRSGIEIEMRNLSIYNKSPIKKDTIHKLISLLSHDLSFKVKNLEISFVDSTKIKEVNRDFLRHNYSTDIITFNYSFEKNIIDGEIIISLTDLKNNSIRYKTALKQETIRVIIHGLLHLLGYDDIEKTKRRRMKLKENFYVKKYTYLLNTQG